MENIWLCYSALRVCITPIWGTPANYSKEGKSQVIANGFKHMGGYELETGKEIWKMSGGGYW
jgi:hypothetical protein